MNFSLQQLVRKNIQSLAPYSSARDEYTGKEGVFLDANENPYGQYNRYPDPHQLALKEQLALLKGVDVDSIFLGNGSDEIIDLTYRIFCEPGKDKSLTFSPTYGMYEVSACIHDVELIQLPLNAAFQIDIKNCLPLLADENLKVIFICSPNNPSGNIFDAKDIESILANFRGIVVIDEAYIDFCNHPSFVEKVNSYPNLVILQTLSKAWGLAGIRIGIAYMHQEVLAYYNKVKPPYNISIVNQMVALDVLKNEVLYKQNVTEILNEKEKLIEELRELPMVRKIYPSDANFLLIEVIDANDLYQKLVQQKIIVRNRNSVVKNCVRITVGTPRENQIILQAIKAISND